MIFTEAKLYDKTLLPDISENPFATPYYGLFYKPVEAGGKERRVLLYTPKSAMPQMRKIFIYLPEHVKAEEFLTDSVWADLSEKSGAFLVLLEAADGKYGDMNDEIAFLYEAEKKVFYDSEERFAPVIADGCYLAGYGKGADIALRAGMLNPAKWSALAIMGAEEMPASEVSEIGDSIMRAYSEERVVEGLKNKHCVLPVWYVGEEQENRALLQYLKEINGTGEKYDVLPYGHVYREQPGPHNDSHNRKPVSEVVLTECSNGAEAYKDAELTRAIWDELFYKIIRNAIGPCGALRPYIPTEEPMFRIYTRKMEHADFKEPVPRKWAVYTPSYYDGKTPMPLVVATHGATASYEYFARNTEWWRVAEERGFIVVFTQGTPGDKVGTPYWKSFRYGKPVPNMPRLFQTTEEQSNSEVNYFRYVVDFMKEHYAVDPTRVYCTGHSNGGAMTYTLTQTMRDVFAAAAEAGFCTRQYDPGEDMPEAELKLPVMNIENSLDRWNDPDDREMPLYAELYFRQVENGMDPENPNVTEGDNGTWTTRTFLNKQGFPMVEYVGYKNACHAYFPDESYLVWDTFLCNYSRGEDGTLYYRGVKVE